MRYQSHSVPEWVARGLPIRIDDRGWLEFDAATPDGDGPALQMHLLVVGWAQQAAISHLRFPTVNPMNPVMGVANAGWSIAARKTAPAIAGHQRPTDA
jgi:hypothetical protein